MFISNIQAHAGMQGVLSLAFNQLKMELKFKSSSVSSHKLVSNVWTTHTLNIAVLSCLVMVGFGQS